MRVGDNHNQPYHVMKLNSTDPDLETKITLGFTQQPPVLLLTHICWWPVLWVSFLIAYLTRQRPLQEIYSQAFCGLIAACGRGEVSQGRPVGAAGPAAGLVEVSRAGGQAHPPAGRTSTPGVPLTPPHSRHIRLEQAV